MDTHSVSQHWVPFRLHTKCDSRLRRRERERVRERERESQWNPCFWHVLTGEDALIISCWSWRLICILVKRSDIKPFWRKGNMY